jgi:hypothetical protein
MAGNLSEMFPQMDLPVGPLAGYTQGIQFNNARQNQMLNQAGALQDLWKNDQMYPLDIQGKQLSNQGQGLINTGQDIANQDKQMSLEMRKKAAPEEYKALVTKFATEIDDNEMKQYNNHIQRLAYSQNPQERAMGQELMNMSKDIWTEKEKLRIQGENTLANTKEHNKGILAVAQEATARKAAGGGGGKGEASVIAKMGYEKAAVYYDFKAQEAEAEGDTEAAARYAAQANKMKIARETEKAIAAQATQAGKIDPGAVTGMPTNPAFVPQGFTSPPAPAPAPQAPVIKSLADLQKMYPLRSAEKLKEAYKKKTGIDLQ